MRDAFKIQKAGMGGDVFAYAFIVVRYPADSVCTCEKGLRIYAAPDTSGHAVFALPEGGTWTVSCSLGLKTDTKEVHITEIGQREEIMLSYGTMIYATDFTCVGKKYNGQSGTNRAPTKTVDGTTATFTMGTGTSSVCGIAYTTEPVYLAESSKLVLHGYIQASGNASGRTSGMYVWKSIGSYVGSNVYAYNQTPTGVKDANVVIDLADIDFSSSDGYGYIGFSVMQQKTPETEIFVESIEII